MSVFEIVFSPTGGTQKVSGLVAGALDKNTVTVDLTDSGLDFSAVSMTEDDVAVISVPAYAGRIPAVVADRLGMLRPSMTPRCLTNVSFVTCSFSHSERSILRPGKSTETRCSESKKRRIRVHSRVRMP